MSNSNSGSAFKYVAGIGVITLVIFGVASANSATTKTIEENEVIKYTTSTINDNTIYEGETVIQQKGENGSKVVTYLVTYKNNKEVSRKKQSEKIIKPVKNEVVAKGTKKQPEPEPEPEVYSVRVGAICRDGWKVPLLVEELVRIMVG